MVKNGQIINECGLFLKNIPQKYFAEILMDPYYANINSNYGLTTGVKQEDDSGKDDLVGLYVIDYKRFTQGEEPIISYDGLGRGAY